MLMPTIVQPTPGNASPKVLVTGANGYIAMWVVRILLEQGYAVRGSMRTEEKAKLWEEAVLKYAGGDKARVEWVLVKDMLKEDAFDEAVNGVVAIAHMASPLTADSDDPDEYIQPAVNGTLNVLKSASKFGKAIKRIVITSSCAAVMRTVPPGQPTVIFTEDDWGDEFVETVKAQGKNADGATKYRASKVLAERATWDFVAKSKGKVEWDVTTLCPPLVLGPPLNVHSTPSSLSVSLARFYSTIFEDKPSEADLKASYAFVDVRDIAAAHVKTLQVEKAGGERIVVAAGATTWQDTRDLVHALHPELNLPRGKPSLEKHVLFAYDNTKSKRVLGMQYITQEKTVGDTVEDFVARGWSQK